VNLARLPELLMAQPSWRVNAGRSIKRSPDNKRPPLLCPLSRCGDQLERGPLVQSATQIMMAASATKRISKMIRCMATSTGYPRIDHSLTYLAGIDLRAGAVHFF